MVATDTDTSENSIEGVGAGLQGHYRRVVQKQQSQFSKLYN